MKVDITKIPGYETMTAEEKVAALEAFEVANDESAEIKKLKDMLSTRNSEVADFKRKWRDTLDEAQKAELERKEANDKLIEELNTLRTEKKIKEYETSFLGTGYSAELAAASAKAMVEGDTATVFANLAQFVADQKKLMEANALNHQPTLTSGSSVTAKDTITKAQFDSMSYLELVKLKNENPELYAEFSK